MVSSIVSVANRAVIELAKDNLKPTYFGFTRHMLQQLPNKIGGASFAFDHVKGSSTLLGVPCRGTHTQQGILRVYFVNGSDVSDSRDFCLPEVVHSAHDQLILDRAVSTRRALVELDPGVSLRLLGNGMEALVSSSGSTIMIADLITNSIQSILAGNTLEYASTGIRFGFNPVFDRSEAFKDANRQANKDCDCILRPVWYYEGDKAIYRSVSPNGSSESREVSLAIFDYMTLAKSWGKYEQRSGYVSLNIVDELSAYNELPTKVLHALNVRN